jgi:hypothetical protein
VLPWFLVLQAHEPHRTSHTLTCFPGRRGPGRGPAPGPASASVRAVGRGFPAAAGGPRVPERPAARGDINVVIVAPEEQVIAKEKVLDCAVLCVAIVSGKLACSTRQVSCASVQGSISSTCTPLYVSRKGVVR